MLLVWWHLELFLCFQYELCIIYTIHSLELQALKSLGFSILSVKGLRGSVGSAGSGVILK
jgi:hypothetical protein